MPEEDEVVKALKEAMAAKERADAHIQELKDQAASDLADAVAVAIRAGMKPKRVAEVLKVNYETIRRMARGKNVERLREPTVTSRSKATPADA